MQRDNFTLTHEIRARLCQWYILKLRRFLLRSFKHLRVFENRVLRRVFEPKRDEVTGEWRKLHNDEFRDFYSLPNIVRVVKSRRMRWAGHVARMGRGEVFTGF